MGVNIGLFGFGKMGKTIKQLVETDASFGTDHVIFAVNDPSALAIHDLKAADVVIDFSLPEAATQNIELCFDHHIPIVVGTTGWYDSFESIKATCTRTKGSLLTATNFSIGVNLFFAFNKLVAQKMNEQPAYDVEITEVHHTEKLDAPSGTAITLAEQIINNVNRKTSWVNKRNNTESDLLILSAREPNVPGTHTVTYSSTLDDISLTHQAHNREGFAKGAIVAAKWLVGKTGVFTMQDVLAL